jgi:two-component system NtrC family sensor kinase
VIKPPIAFDAQEVNALLDCVLGPVLLLRAGEAIAFGNASAVELHAWFTSSDASRDLAAALAPAIPVAGSARRPDAQTIVVTLQCASEVREYRATCQCVSAPDPATIIVLSLCTDSGANAVRTKAQAEIAQAHLEDVQRQLLQADRMSSIGQLAAGVAHEINNPIGYIQSNLGTLTEYVANLFRLFDAQEAALRRVHAVQPEQLAQIEEVRQQIDFDFLAKDVPQLLAESQEGIVRVRKIVNDLREFSRAGHSDAWVYADIHSGLESTLNIVWNDLKYKVELVKRYGDLPLIECLPSQLNQVFMNILVNAGHAIEERGQIALVTRSDEHMVYVEISDSGNGIAEKYRERIFEPFYTTKPVGEGTGLGLSISYGIVRKHGGEIDVRSEIGIGTTFLIKLPIHQPRPANAVAKIPAQAQR